jgi:hypothetical protein
LVGLNDVKGRADDLVNELVVMVRPAPAPAALGWAILATVGVGSADQA